MTDELLTEICIKAQADSVADLEIQKGGFSASANFGVATPTSGHAGSPN